MHIKQVMSGAVAAVVMSIGMPLSALAASSTVTVTQQNQQGWSTADTRTGGTISFIKDSTSPAPSGALQLRTDATTTSKAQYLHAANVPLTDVNSLSYYTKNISLTRADADPSYQLPTCLLGLDAPKTEKNPIGCNGFTTFVFEPYQNGTVMSNDWQNWNVLNGQLWSSRTVGSGTCQTVNGAGGPPFYSLAAIKTSCPKAVVVGFGVNIGSNNPNFTVETDLVNFNGTSYDFQFTKVPTDKEQCKKDGYQNFTDEVGADFKNQGSCVSYANSQDSADAKLEF